MGGEDDEAMALLKAVSGVGGVSCEDYRYLDGVLYAIVYNESMNRNFVMAAANDDGTVSIMVCNEDVARTGTLTEGGGAPTVMDVCTSTSASAAPVYALRKPDVWAPVGFRRCCALMIPDVWAPRCPSC